MVTREEAENAVQTLLEYIEEDVSREGLIDTPARVIKSWEEVFAGYNQSPADVLDSTFNGEGYDGIVLLRDIEFHSTCEHHMQPFTGRAHVAYIPTERIVGISKLARIVDLHARRLQNQERITKDVADDLEEHLRRVYVKVDPLALVDERRLPRPRRVEVLPQHERGANAGFSRARIAEQ